MINLLPENYKTEINAARMNVLLIRYIALQGIALAVLAGIIIASYVVLDMRKTSAQELLETNTARTAQYIPIKTEADELKASLSNAKSILDQKISYSKLIYKIADSLPPGVVIQQLDLDPTTFGSKMTINAYAKTIDDASKLKAQFSRHSDVFTNVELDSLESSSTNETGGQYPINAALSLTINKAGLQ